MMRYKLNIRGVVGAFAAPLPVIAFLTLMALSVTLSPTAEIDGRPDNAPHRAASVLLIAIPFLFYPALVLLIAVQTYMTRRLLGRHLWYQLCTGLIASGIVSALLAKAMYAPQFGESFLRTWIIDFAVCSVLSAIMLSIWWIIAGRSPTTN